MDRFMAQRLQIGNRIQAFEKRLHEICAKAQDVDREVSEITGEIERLQQETDPRLPRESSVPADQQEKYDRFRAEIDTVRKMLAKITDDDANIANEARCFKRRVKSIFIWLLWVIGTSVTVVLAATYLRKLVRPRRSDELPSLLEGFRE
jgi:peptidoglycan hydrolase CwlO-like protein